MWTEAVEPTQASLEAGIAQKNWNAAARFALNLSELTLTLGGVPRAVKLGVKSVELAKRTDDDFASLDQRTVWAYALHQAGLWEESAVVFRESEVIQKTQPQYPRLYGIPGSRYCDLLLNKGEPENGSCLDGIARLDGRSEEAERFRQACREVLERARYAQKIALTNRWLLELALGHLFLGRAHLGLALVAGEDRNAELTRVADPLDRAMDGLRTAAQETDLPHGLLARAALRRFRSDFTGASADLSEALEIAERGSMRLPECDAHLEWARLCRDQGYLAAARRHVVRARVLVKETGYVRREREVAWLERALG